MNNNNHKTTFRFFFSAAATILVLLLCSSQPSCQALSPTKSTATNVRIQLLDPNNQKSVKLLQDCRRLAFAENKQNWLDSERDFVAAKSVVEKKNLCAVATTQNGKIVGSADVALKDALGKTNVVLNVFVDPSLRGQGIGKRLMEEGVHKVLAKALPKENKDDDANTATMNLDVYTNNKAAMALYQNLGYQPSSPVHAGTLAMANALGANLVVSLSKTVPISSK